MTPLLQVTLVEGRDEAQIGELIRGLTEQVVSTLEVDPGRVRVVVNEVPPSHWGVGGVTKEESR